MLKHYTFLKRIFYKSGYFKPFQGIFFPKDSKFAQFKKNSAAL